MNNFQIDLKESQTESRKSYWLESIYPQYFPTIISSSLHDNDKEYQKYGIDRMIFLKDGYKIGIDEKTRYTDYGDLLLEESSSIEYNTPGWIEKQQWIDYIVYNILPIQKCYLIPFIPLQNAWKQNKEQWKQQYKEIRAINDGYTTLSWPIPPLTLFISMTQSQIINYIK